MVDYSIGREFDAFLLKERTTVPRWMHTDTTVGETCRSAFEKPVDQNKQVVPSKSYIKEKTLRDNFEIKKNGGCKDADQDHLGFQPGGRNYWFAQQLLESSQLRTKVYAGSKEKTRFSANIANRSASIEIDESEGKVSSPAEMLAARIVKYRKEVQNRLVLLTVHGVKYMESSLPKEPTTKSIVALIKGA